jgi:hypothetical protein
MKLFITVFLIALYYVFSDLIPAFRKRNYKLITVYLILIVAALALNVLMLLNVKIPSISEAIKSILEVFMKFSY